MIFQAFARIENHYFVNRGFFTSDSFLLDNIEKIRHIKTTIVQVYTFFLYYPLTMLMLFNQLCNLNSIKIDESCVVICAFDSGAGMITAHFYFKFLVA